MLGDFPCRDPFGDRGTVDQVFGTAKQVEKFPCLRLEDNPFTDFGLLLAAEFVINVGRQGSSPVSSCPTAVTT